MPELPDLELYAYKINKFIAGKRLEKVKVVDGRKLTVRAKVFNQRLDGKILERVYRMGKELRFAFENGSLLGCYLLLTGDISLFSGKNCSRDTVVELYFEGCYNLAIIDPMCNANIKLEVVDHEGLDALSDELDLDYMKKAFSVKRKVKELLMDQYVIKGIGDRYSDEILWAAKISPFSFTNAIPDEKIIELVKIIKQTLYEATRQLLSVNADTAAIERIDHFKIYSRERSPTGAAIKVNILGMRKTYYTDEQELY